MVAVPGVGVTMLMSAVDITFMPVSVPFTFSECRFPPIHPTVAIAFLSVSVGEFARVMVGSFASFALFARAVIFIPLVCP